MSNPLTKTNNDQAMIEAKIQLRLESLPKGQDMVTVLECFGGEGVLWREVQRRTKVQIKILSIDKNKYHRMQLLGENLKFLRAFDLSAFDIIDLDAWGSPYKQLEIVFKRKYKGVVHCTFIQNMQGGVDKKLLMAGGYSEAMIKKCPSIFNRHGIEKVKNYLALRGVKLIRIAQKDRKNYFWFNLNK